jgi:hypothetical protein
MGLSHDVTDGDFTLGVGVGAQDAILTNGGGYNSWSWSRDILLLLDVGSIDDVDVEIVGVHDMILAT